MMGPEEDITEKLALVQRLVEQSSPLDGKNLPVWLRKAIEEHYNPMDPSLVTYSVPEAGENITNVSVKAEFFDRTNTKLGEDNDGPICAS